MMPGRCLTCGATGEAAGNCGGRNKMNQLLRQGKRGGIRMPSKSKKKQIEINREELVGRKRKRKREEDKKEKNKFTICQPHSFH